MANKNQVRFAEALAARDAARKAVAARIETLKSDLAPSQLGNRITSDLRYRASEAATQAMEIASDNRGALAGVAMLAGAWLLRRPLVKAGQRLWRRRQAAPLAADDILPAPVDDQD